MKPVKVAMLMHLMCCAALVTIQAGQTSQALANEAAVVPARSNRIALMTGYHGYNAPILLKAMKPRGVLVDKVSGWLDLTRYDDYGVVILDGWLKEAKIEHHAFNPDDLTRLKSFINNGGTFIFMYRGWQSFNTEHGKAFLKELMGTSPQLKGGARVDFTHPWTRHLAATGVPKWVNTTARSLLPYDRGTSLIDIAPGQTFLYHVRSGKGQMIFIAWDIFRSRPWGRSKIEPEQERAFNEQVRILECIAEDLYPDTRSPMPKRVFFDHPYSMPTDAVRKVPSPPDAASIRSHMPTRPLPTASDRPMAGGPARFVDVRHGKDDADGSKDKPWRTIQHAINQLQPGETLYLRKGVYHEQVILSRSGEPGKPITIRSYPGELVTIDGGLGDFYHKHESAWEPVADGAEGEFQSTATYPGLGTNPNATNLLGNFADSMIPLHGYRFLTDLRSDNPYWNLKKNTEGGDNQIYCGPGIWYNPETERIHCRLAHTTLPGLRDDNYRGETDPRKLPLVIGYNASPIRIAGARHIRLQDMVLRGSRSATLSISMAGDIVLDGLTVYGGRTCVHAEYTQGLRAIHCAFRGIGAPWTFRGHLKYRAIEAQIFSASAWQPTGNRDFELAYCEFTDSVDGVFIGNVTNFRFHHNLIDNVTDDGMYLSATATDSGEMPGGPVLIYQNRFSRCLTAFAFGVGHGRQSTTDTGIVTGAGLWIYRNVFDFRRPVWYAHPTGPDAPQELLSFGRSQGDHGSPIWEPMFVYHNTIVAREPSFRGYYAHGWGGHMRKTVRAVLNNIVVQATGPVGATLDPSGFTLLLDGNLHWSLAEKGNLHKMRWLISRALKDKPLVVSGFPRALSYPQSAGTDQANPLMDLMEMPTGARGTPYRCQRDRLADPKFVRLETDWRERNDYRLESDSPAAGAAVPLPSKWPDPLKDADTSDIGAIPVGHDGWPVGVHGRFHVAKLPH